MMSARSETFEIRGLAYPVRFQIHPPPTFRRIPPRSRELPGPAVRSQPLRLVPDRPVENDVGS
jgi:hypothetical protein